MITTIRTIRINGYKTKHRSFEDAEKAIRNNEYNPNGEGKFYITETLDITTEINHTVGLSDDNKTKFIKFVEKQLISKEIITGWCLTSNEELLYEAATILRSLINNNEIDKIRALTYITTDYNPTNSLRLKHDKYSFYFRETAILISTNDSNSDHTYGRNINFRKEITVTNNNFDKCIKKFKNK